MADADVIVVGAGLAGLVAACELVECGRRVLIVDQENADNIGGQAFWSFGGLFFVDSPEQRRLGIRDSHELALQDWLGARLRPARGPLAEAVGTRLCGFRGGGEAQLAARARSADVRTGRVGRARRL
jgi:glycine/D-amino acid oxidase-like deaminating enzyme